jgi:hypothetical protein
MRRMARVLVACCAAAGSVIVGLAVPDPSALPAYAAGIGFVGVTPARLLDTRDGTGAPVGAVGGGGQVDLQVTGRGGVPATGVSAVVLNVTVTEPTAAGFVTVWPAGETRPTASNLNFVPGQTVPNVVIAKVGAGGRVSLFNSAGATHLLADVNGYYTAGSQLVPIVPARLLDTRDGTGGITGPTNPGTEVDVVVAGHAGVPVGATSVVMNVTVTEPESSGYLTVWPNGAPRPTASNLNFVAGQTVPNLVISQIGAEGKISYFNNAGRLHVVIDVLGYVANPVSMTEALAPVAQVGYYIYTWDEATVPVQGQARSNSLRLSSTNICDISTPQFWVEYNLGRQWGTLATTLSFDDIKGTAVSKVRFRILGDGAVLVDKTLTFGQAVDVVANVSNVLRVRFEVLNANATASTCSTNPVFASPVLAK